MITRTFDPLSLMDLIPWFHTIQKSLSNTSAIALPTTRAGLLNEEVIYVGKKILVHFMFWSRVWPYGLRAAAITPG